MEKQTVKNIVSAGASVAADSLKQKAMNASGWLAVLLWLATAICMGVASIADGPDISQQQPGIEVPSALPEPTAEQ
jgi:Na+/proline symporter